MEKIKLVLTIFFAGMYSVFGQTPTWQAIQSIANTDNQRFDDIFFLNQNVGWAANGGHAAIYKTTDGGETWTEQINETDLGINLYFRNIEFLDENIGFIGTLNNKVYKTTNGGTNWTEITNISPNPAAICGFDTVGTTVYGCGAYFEPAYIIKSTDSGTNWQYIDMSAHATGLVEIKFVSATVGYASGKSATGGVILKTTDGGSTWTEIYNTGIAGEYVWKLQIFDSNTDIIFGAVTPVSPTLGKLIKSVDAGTNWTSTTGPETDIQAVGFISETHGWMGGHTAGIFETTDGGSTWSNLGVGGNLNRIFVINSTTVFASGTTVYKYTNGTLGTQDILGSERKSLQIKMFNNPVSEILKFSIEYTDSDHMLIELYDITGKFIKQFSRENIIEQNIKKYEFPVKDLAGGIYFLNFHNNTGRQSIKFIKL